MPTGEAETLFCATETAAAASRTELAREYDQLKQKVVTTHTIQPAVLGPLLVRVRRTRYFVLQALEESADFTWVCKTRMRLGAPGMSH
jgi:hypothetical protein